MTIQRCCSIDRAEEAMSDRHREQFLQILIRYLKSNLSSVLLIGVVGYMFYNLLQQLWWSGGPLRSAEVITMVGVILAFLWEWRFSEYRGIDRLKKITDEIRFAQSGADRFFVPRFKLPPLRERIRDIRDQNNNKGFIIAAYGPSLSGLLTENKGLFLEHLNNGGTLLFALLKPETPPRRFETSPWQNEGGLRNAIDNSLTIIDQLKKGKASGSIDFITLDTLPDGSIFILDLNGPFEQVQYQLDIPGLARDMLPIILSDRLTYVHSTLKDSWNCVWKHNAE